MSANVDDIIVITGLGSLGLAIAHRLRRDHALVLASNDQEKLDAVKQQLSGDGSGVHPVWVNVSDFESVKKLAAAVQSFGTFRAVIHTASMPPSELTAGEIIGQGVLGTANILEAFGKIARPGSIAVCVAGIAGAMAHLSKQDEKALVRTHARKLARSRMLNSMKRDTDTAYAFATRAIQLRVEAASIDWGLRGGRTVSISPGAFSTAQTEPELLALPRGARKVIAESPSKFQGTLDNIVDAIVFLISEDASFITGTDLRIDGGAVPASRWSAK